MTIAEYYLLGALCVANIITILNLTNISVYIYNFLNFKKNIDPEDKFYTVGDLQEHLALNCGKIGELFLCPLCLSTHLSWIISFMICYFSEVSYWLVLFSTFSWPYIAYFLFILVKNK